MTGPGLRMRGIAASPGIAISRARVVDRRRLKVPKLRVPAGRTRAEVERLTLAVRESRRQLEAAQFVIADGDGEKKEHQLILQAYLLMLDDELFIKSAMGLVQAEGINAEWAVARKMEEIKAVLMGLGDEYFAERAQDVDFVGNRVLRNLMGHGGELSDELREPCIVVAEEISPADTAHMVGKPVLAFATEGGTRTSHTSIMAQALGIPAVVGVERLTERLASGDLIIVDGTEGLVVIRPDEATVREYRRRAERLVETERRLLADRDLPAVTRDGERVTLLANIEFAGEAAMSLDFGAEGVGLYRTEFLYIDRPAPPEEEEQFRVYKAVLETVAPRPVVFRTFDLGADKVPGDRALQEANPAMGLRAVRLGLKHRALFKAQLRALLRAAPHGRMRIMFPMISGVGELRQVRAVLDEARRELGDGVAPEVEVGCMIELPSAVFMARELAREVDFFSIGTNDLIQYALAIDRVNDHVAYLYSPFHPAVLRAIRMVVEAAERQRIPVAICGGMAGEPLMVPLLVGLGLRHLSMAPAAIPAVKEAILATHAGQARLLAEEALSFCTAVEVEDLVRRKLAERPSTPDPVN